MVDQLIRATAADGGVRVVGVIATQLTNEASRRHKLSTVATAALGRAMSASLLLASSMKRPHSRVNIRVAGDGNLGLVFADAGMDGTVRGFVANPSFDLPLNADGDPDVREAIGKTGFLRVMRDVGYGDPFASTVELVSGEIGEDVAWYLASSEQTFSKLMVGEFIGDSDLPNGDASRRKGVNVSAGILLQILPKAARDENLMAQIDARVEASEGLTRLLKQGKSLEQIMSEILGDLNLHIFPATQPVKFQCPCSLERVLGALKMFGEAELKDMIAKDNGAEATCHFCAEVYRADSQQLEEIINGLKAETSVNN
ncbi:Hsp33 family molecular chaperone HslO [Tumidithrix helvetica PCC 7403]|uniref:Hsp33 family molecular chaperone HslO n=1 Tax=Tumidithrix helvetica TaxID=3457545 RepID=UPI003CC162FC